MAEAKKGGCQLLLCMDPSDGYYSAANNASSFLKAIGIAILRATHHCIRGPRIPASKISHHIDWTGPAGLALF
eukprot:scaffold6637_cov109-Cylindrotheca_fusiformis.AAC.2